MIDLWIEALETVRDTEKFRAVLVSGKGKAFCTGGDVKEMMAGNGFYQSEQMDLRSSLDLISSHMGIVTELPNHKEGVQALIEKCKPKFNQ